MFSYKSLTAALSWVAIFYLVLLAMCWVLGRLWSRDVTPAEVTPMSHRRTWWLAHRATLWRALSWAAFAVGLDGASLRHARRAERLDKRSRQRARAVERESARALDWDRTLASSPSSRPSLPPSAPRPRPDLDFSADEATRRWERTLPWGTPSPLLTREGLGKPYPFVPLAEQPPSSAPGTAYRSPPMPRRPKPLPLPAEPISRRK